MRVVHGGFREENEVRVNGRWWKSAADIIWLVQTREDAQKK